MKYFELINKAYDYVINENIGDELEILNLTNEMPIEMLKEELKKAKLFLNLYYQKQNNKLSKINEKLFIFLDAYFTEEITDIHASIEETMKHQIIKNLKLLKEDESCKEVLDILKEMDLPEEEQKYYINYLIDNFIYNLETSELEPQLVTKVFYTSINNILENVRETIPQLLFTEQGKKYIDNSFWIEDEEKRNKIKLYIKKINSDISDYNTLTRIKDFNQMVKQIIDIIPLLKIISTIPNGVDNLIQMDKYLEENFRFIYKEVPLLMLLTNYKEEKQINLDDEIRCEVDQNIINLFFSDNSKLTLEEKVLLIITYYYNGAKENIYEEINKNFDKIIEIMHSNSLNKIQKEKEIKKISKIIK